MGKAGEEGEVTRGVPAGDFERNAEPFRAWPGEGSPDAITGRTESGVGCGGSAGRFGEAAVARRPGGGRVEAVVVDSAAVVARGRPARGRFLRGGEFESSSESASRAVASSTSVASQSRSRLGDGAAVRVRATSRDGEGLFGDLVTPRVEVRDFGGGERVEVAGAASLLSFAGLRFALDEVRGAVGERSGTVARRLVGEGAVRARFGGDGDADPEVDPRVRVVVDAFERADPPTLATLEVLPLVETVRCAATSSHSTSAAADGFPAPVPGLPAPVPLPCPFPRARTAAPAPNEPTVLARAGGSR